MTQAFGRHLGEGTMNSTTDTCQEKTVAEQGKDFAMPTPDIIKEYTQYARQGPEESAVWFVHRVCDTDYKPSDVLDSLRWMREHFHACSNEIVLEIPNYVYVRARLLEDGQTEIIVHRWQSNRVLAETTTRLRTYKETEHKGFDIDLEEMNKDRNIS